MTKRLKVRNTAKSTTKRRMGSPNNPPRIRRYDIAYLYPKGWSDESGLETGIVGMKAVNKRIKELEAKGARAIVIVNTYLE